VVRGFTCKIGDLGPVVDEVGDQVARENRTTRRSVGAMMRVYVAVMVCIRVGREVRVG
jgi:hypothetical protein